MSRSRGIASFNPQSVKPRNPWALAHESPIHAPSKSASRNGSGVPSPTVRRLTLRSVDSVPGVFGIFGFVSGSLGTDPIFATPKTGSYYVW
eukprot:4746037-Alexandrium_andersonii.AAC.1